MYVRLLFTQTYSGRTKYSIAAVREKYAFFLKAIMIDTDVIEILAFTVLVLRIEEFQKSSLVFLPGTIILTHKKQLLLLTKSLNFLVITK
jgi:hypothetical protein